MTNVDYRRSTGKQLTYRIEKAAAKGLKALNVFVRPETMERAYLESVAELAVPEYPGQSFPALVVNSAQAVGAQSGAELVELQLDNSQGRIKSGDYAQVTFRLTSPADAPYGSAGNKYQGQRGPTPSRFFRDFES